MRLIQTVVALSGLILLGSACDVTNMPGNIADMGSKLDATNQGVNNTVQTTGDMDNKLGVVADATHKQIMSGGLDDMTSDNNTRVLVPVPFGMLAGGKTFAEEAHEDDLMDWFYAEYKDLVEGTADDGQRISVNIFLPKLDSAGNEVLETQYSAQTIGGKSVMVPQTEWDFPQSYLDNFNHQKDIILNEMQVVAYFIPQDMIANIVADQVAGGGLRQQTAFLILNLRDVFARGAMLANGLYDDKLKDLGQLKEALRIVNLIDYIARLPNVSQVGGTKIRGYQDMAKNYIYELQADPSKLSLIAPVPATTTPFVPLSIAYLASQPINNVDQTYYTLGSDNLTVVPIDQSAARTAEIAYDPQAYKQDWKDLKRHFQLDLSKADQNSADGQSYLAEIQSHLQ